MAESMQLELEFYKEMSLFDRGLERLKKLNMPDYCLEHVILAYYYAYFAV